MNIGSLFFKSLDKNEIDDFDNGSVFAFDGETIEINFFAVDFDFLDIGDILGGVFEDLVHGGTGASDSAEGFGDAPFGGDHGDDLEFGALAKVIEGEDIEGVGHGHKELVSEATNGGEFVEAGHFLGNEVGDFLGHMNLGEVDGRNIEASAHRDHHILFGDILFVGQEFEETPALFFLKADGFSELAWQEETVFDEDIGDSFAKRFNAHFSIR